MERIVWLLPLTGSICLTVNRLVPVGLWPLYQYIPGGTKYVQILCLRFFLFPFWSGVSLWMEKKFQFCLNKLYRKSGSRIESYCLILVVKLFFLNSHFHTRLGAED